MGKWLALCCVLCAAVVALSCSGAPSEQAARYEARADGYVQQEKFREALIEYTNAARATSDNSVIPRTLAAGTLSVRDSSILALAKQAIAEGLVSP